VDDVRLAKRGGKIPHKAPREKISKITHDQNNYDLNMASKTEQPLETLKSTITTIEALITQLQTTVFRTESKDVEKASNVNALDLAHDTASLIKAHSTKLSLLIINKPFTASAIITVLRELISGPLPGLASSVEICNASKYTKAMSSELAYRSSKVFTELRTLVKAIPLDGMVLGGDGKEGGRGSLKTTGAVWDACEKVMELKKLGVAGLCVRKAEEWRDLVKDALEELKEWGEEESDSDEEDGKEDVGSGNEDNGLGKSKQEEVDEIFGSQRHIPSGDPEKIRPRLESSLKSIRLLGLMYAAIVKRRFRSLPTLPYPDVPPQAGETTNIETGIISCLDDVLETMKKIPEITDELASAFYELDAKEIDKQMNDCFLAGSSVVELLIKNWEGQEDEFSTWVSGIFHCFKLMIGN
jgi:hypothetical protein